MRIIIWILLLITVPSSANQLALTLEGESIQYLKEQNHNEALHQFTLSGQYSKALTNDSRLLFSPRIRRSNFDGTKNGNQLIEGYIDFRFDDSDLRVGQQIIAWGRADIVNPINIGRQDFTDPLDDDKTKLGQMAFSYRQYFNEFDTEVIWLPIYQDSLLPNLDNPWFMDLPDQTASGESLNYELADLDQPSKSLENSQIAFRLTSQMDGWDFGLSYFNGWNDIPAYLNNITQSSPNNLTIKLSPTPYKQQMVGFDTSTNTGTISTRLEYAYIYPDERNRLDDPYHHLVAGLDTDFDLLGDNLNSRVLIEYSRQFKTTNIEYTPQNLDHIFENTIFIRFSVDSLPVWNLEIDGAYDIKNDGQLIRPKFIYNLLDDLKLAVSLEWLKGSEQSFFGTYDKNQSIRLTLIHESLVF